MSAAGRPDPIDGRLTPVPGSPISRRSFIAAGGLAAGSLVAPVGWDQALAARPRRRHALRPVRMGSTHVHASFSEGPASMAAGLAEARRYGLDVVWWTEHDFRMTAGGYKTAVRFDDAAEGTGPTRWEWVRATVGTPATAEATYVDAPRSPDEEGRALRMVARAEGEAFGGLRLTGNAWNSTYTTNLADTAVELDVLAETLGDDALLVIEIQLSNQPAIGGRPAGQYRLRYELGPAAAPGAPHPDPADPLLGIVGLRASGNEIGGGWRRVRIRPVDDIAACWPDLLAGDNSLYRLALGAWARRGATASVVIDRLRFYRDRREGDESLAIQAELIRHYARQYPEIRQYQGSEISLVRHINWLGGDFHLPRYPSYYPEGPPVKDDSEAGAIRMVDYIHAAGGLAQLNHPRDDEEDLGAYLVRTRALGCDLVEIGRDPLTEYIAGWDVAARNAVFFTATGVNDDHAGTWDRDYPWTTSVWARSTKLVHLVAALGAGRAWMSDPDRWDGELDLQIHGSPAMGAAVVDAPRHVRLEVLATGLPAGGTLEIVQGPVDLAGGDPPDPALQTEVVAAASVRGGRVHLSVDRGHYVRTVVRDGAGEIVGLSNPVWVLDEDTDVAVPAARRLRLERGRGRRRRRRG